jgi:hypothetical protein
MSNPEFGSNPEQEQHDREYLEQAKKVGDYYSSLVGQFTGKETQPVSLEGLPENTINLLFPINSRAKAGFAEQHRVAQEQAVDAQYLLRQVKTFETIEELGDTSKYRMEELSEGVFAVFVKPDLAQKLRSGAQGVAVKLKGGISFVLIPDYSDMHPEYNERNLKENIPHEVHHLAWGFAKGDVITSTEEDKDFNEAYLMYQDEVMARLCSGGGLSGYTHIAMLDPETKAKFKQDHPETAAKLTDTVIELNELLQEIQDTKKRTEIRHEDLIMAVIEAKNFSELKANLLKAKAIIEKQPITNEEEPDTGGGWGSVTA